MKYKFSIIAPHPDDEFIGCRKFIKTYNNNIDNVIFVTNGERSLFSFPDMSAYIDIRREETKTWLESIGCKCDIHYLNIPDQVDLLDVGNIYEADMFETVNRESQIKYILDKVERIVGDNIVLVNSYEEHPSHKLGFSLGQSLMNKRIYYCVHSALSKSSIKGEGLYYSRIKLLGEEKYFNYYYIYDEDELLEKQAEFQFFYYSQFEDFQKTGLIIRNWEQYISEVPLKLTSEDKTYKINTGGVSG